MVIYANGLNNTQGGAASKKTNEQEKLNLQLKDGMWMDEKKKFIKIIRQTKKQILWQIG